MIDMNASNPVISSTTSAAPKSSLFSPAVDWFCLGGLTLLLAIPFYILHQNQWEKIAVAGYPVNAWLSAASFSGSLVVNYPHYAATYYRVYRSTGEIKKYAFEALWFPLILLVLGFFSFLSPDWLALWFCNGYLLFSGYHYSGQTYGIAMIFSGKAGVRLNAWQKWCFLIPIYGAYAYPTISGNTVSGEDVRFYGLTIPKLGLPDWMAPVTLWIFFAGLAAYVGVNLYQWVRHQKRLPGIVHVVVVSHLVWFWLMSDIKGFQTFVPFFHCLQYLVITSYFHFKEVKSKTDATLAGTWDYLGSEAFSQYYLVLIIIGVLLFLTVPFVIETTGIATFGLASAITVSFLNIHHFVLDAAIWKLRRPEVGTPLISN